MNFNNSLTDVANAALSAIGQPPVNSIESDVASARTCRLHLDACIRHEHYRRTSPVVISAEAARAMDVLEAEFLTRRNF